MLCKLIRYTLGVSLAIGQWARLFTLNGVEYKGNMLKIVYRETSDPVLNEHINWHLNPRVDWTNLTQEFAVDVKSNELKLAEERKRLEVFDFGLKNGLSLSEVILIIVGVILIILTIVYMGMRYLKFRSQRRNDSSKLEDKMELEEMKPHTTHQIVIG